MKNFIIFLLSVLSISCVNNQDPEKQSKIVEDQRGLYLQPYKLKVNTGIIQLTGINQENSIAVLNNKGEIAILSFDEKMKIKEKVIAKGFPGFTEGDLELYSDSEHKLVWLRRGKGVYFADPETTKTGHITSMRPGSKIAQILLVDPEQQIWWICYGVSHFAVDEYNLDSDTKTTLDFTLKGRIWPFGKNEFLLYSTNFSENRAWNFIDNTFDIINHSNINEIANILNTLPGSELEDTKKAYSLVTNIMIVSTMNPSLEYSIYWNNDNIKNEQNVVITPFSDQQKPAYIEGLGKIRQFSSDGKWFDTSARLKSDNAYGPDTRLVYHADRSFPAGVSPPIRLGSPYYLAGDEITGLMGGTFMHHSSWGPCYVMQDGFDALKIFKLNEALGVIQQYSSQTR